MVPARTRPIMCPLRQKYWYACMIGEPSDRKPSTSSGAWSTDTVAPKSSWSDAPCDLVFFTWATEIPHDGSGTRSGSALAGGFARAGTAGADFGGRDVQQLPVGGCDGLGGGVMAEGESHPLEALLGRVDGPSARHAPDQRLRERIADALLRVRRGGRAARAGPFRVVTVRAELHAPRPHDLAGGVPDGQVDEVLQAVRHRPDNAGRPGNA